MTPQPCSARSFRNWSPKSWSSLLGLLESISAPSRTRLTTKIYLKAPAKYWAALVGPTLAPKFANRWLVQDVAKAGNVRSITVQGLAASLNSTDSPLKPAITTTTVDGQRAVVVT